MPTTESWQVRIEFTPEPDPKDLIRLARFCHELPPMHQEFVDLFHSVEQDAESHVLSVENNTFLTGAKQLLFEIEGKCCFSRAA